MVMFIAFIHNILKRNWSLFVLWQVTIFLCQTWQRYISFKHQSFGINCPYCKQLSLRYYLLRLWHLPSLRHNNTLETWNMKLSFLSWETTVKENEEKWCCLIYCQSSNRQAWKCYCLGIGQNFPVFLQQLKSSGFRKGCWYRQLKGDIDDNTEFGGASRNIGIKFLFSWDFRGWKSLIFGFRECWRTIYNCI